MKKFEIPILRYTLEDISLFNFSEFNYKLLDIQGDEFIEYINQLNPKFGGNQSFFNLIREEILSIEDKKFAIVPIDLEKYNRENILKVYYILLIMFPSALQHQYSVHFNVEENGFIQRSMLTTYTERYASEENYLKIIKLTPDKIINLNELINRIYPNLKFDTYIGFAFENYFTSFNASHLHFAFLTLCMSLETVISGNQELLYRLKRSVSILVGDNQLACKNITAEIGDIYKLRSKIVHGEPFDIKNIHSKIKYLQNLVSRTIVELLLHNVDTNINLDKIITSLAYGDRNKISGDWKFYELNSENSYFG